MKEGDNTAAGGEGMDYNRQQGDNTASEVQSAANSEEGDSDDNGMDYKETTYFWESCWQCFYFLGGQAMFNILDTTLLICSKLSPEM